MRESVSHTHPQHPRPVIVDNVPKDPQPPNRPLYKPQQEANKGHDAYLAT